MSESTADIDQAPLFSAPFIWKLTAGIATLCALTIAISAAGRMFGQSMILAGHTEDTTPHQIVIGTDVLELPANVIRFEAARRDGVQEAIDTYFAWPGMGGYSEANRQVFNQTNSADGLIFAQLTQATMSRDMSGRYEPIYKRIVEGSPVPGPGGLVSYRIRSDAGYSSELLYVDQAGGLKPYVVRCLIENGQTGAISTQTGCQRDIFIGQDLSLTYRFSIDLLPQWREIEADVRARFENALGKTDSTARNG
ncbi:hypothetical protein E2A64_09305 [Pseudohoeflea suaedae]|uniref:Uncharacterized protein n=1 Tax=Pseudohoeflea suaedae TaxID=877384 RepID=A0A4R5PQR2_9HYPH|nr:hypothetical protein [Pseudohoeflea suaedae]TDH39243.1 hypothetical protein E2A64_09305 [Pseudohoeflea suaedae]